ncbi:hypothetical protein HMF8227_02969 [Saliniradius amylolyticus]|uniref:DUF1285 domain-containing protein n=1 Tax=Saliniradius amylolyticus TaxID=2183582 RepID=A0A2S2E924_9ALTE|nr:DUF1285 domain-containing protein [Saliniradius amylolyticus]AWL13417.1 hypothetical protein HMF8227_02969 [Saliniradius amylolyticus]
MDLNKLQQQLADEQQALPPVDQWDPPFCGDMDLVIKHDGSWQYHGSPIGRQSLVKLFASVLKREGENYFLVTPVEKLGIRVEDSPFVATQWQRTDDGYLNFTTNVGDRFVLGDDHPIALFSDKTSSAILPYARVRRNLWARLHQNVLYQLVHEASLEDGDTGQQLMLHSGPYSCSLGLTE